MTKPYRQIKVCTSHNSHCGVAADNMGKSMMTMFAGKNSSQAAKDAYIPIRDYVNAEKITLGANTSAIIATDPKLLLFTLSKYKFAGKLLGSRNVIELGCMDGTGTLLLSSMVKRLTSVDFYKPHIEDCKMIQEQGYLKNTQLENRDILDKNEDFKNKFNGAVCYDVLEHLDPNSTNFFFKQTSLYLSYDGIFICGVPSIESQVYASKVNKKSHINCMKFEDLILNAEQIYNTVLPFGMNDEIVHTGFHPMCQYNIVVCSNKK